MSDSERDEQVRRLAEAIKRAGLGSISLSDEMCATMLYEQGVGIRSDLPRPALPVVSEAALKAAFPGYYGLWNDRGRECLRAAFPIMLRDRVAALPKQDGYTVFHSREGSTLHLDAWYMRALLSALGAEP